LEVERVGRGERCSAGDVVAVEEPLEIRLVQEVEGGPCSTSVSITMRTPGHDFELAVGFLHTEGVIDGADAVDRVTYCVDDFVEQQYNVVNVYLRPGVLFDASRLGRNFYTTSSCGVCGKASLEALRVQGRQTVPPGPLVTDAVLYRLPGALRQAQAVFEETGGLHAAALFDPSGELLVLREDVGRHNAVDKLVGQRLLAGAMPIGERILIVSGRASFEIMQKAAVAGIPMVAAVGAPSSLAVETALEFGMSLVGFLRRDSFNVYAGSERIALSS
jgi:FdhD protein